MGRFASTATTIMPQFSGLKARPFTNHTIIALPTPKAMIGARASLKEAGAAAVVATAASMLLASNALAMDVKLGDDQGALVFEPKEFSVDSGEVIVFKNNAGFPHNVVFDDDEVPPGVNAGDISMPEDELLNGPGDTYTVTLTVKGTYTFYCAPHQGAGMVGKLIVK